MPTATFKFGNTGEYQCRVVLSLFGGEKYFVDEVLFVRRWNLRPTGAVTFEAHGHSVRIETRVTFKSLSVRVYVDEILLEQDLFADFNNSTTSGDHLKPQEKIDVPNLIKNLVLWIIIAVILTAIFRSVGAAT